LFRSGYSTQTLEAVYLPEKPVPFPQKPFTAQDLLHKVREVPLAHG
jgi:hypothetical protein